MGVGWEYGFAPNWSAGIEYDHLFMGDANNSFSVVNPLLAGAANWVSQDVDLLMLGVNYRFGGPTPSLRDTEPTPDQVRGAGQKACPDLSP